jgi:alpha-beta hydrolase superfamily lysophospholipase
MKRLLILAVFTLIAGMGVLWLIGVLWMDQLIFHPPPPGYPAEEPYQFTALSDGTRIAYRIWDNPRSDRVMVYSHGNAEDMGNLEGIMPFYRDLGYTVVVYDYPGYGQSGGTPGVVGATDALRRVVQTVSEDRNLRPEQLTMFGKSIGGGPATAVAAELPVGGLILESSFASIFQVPFPSLRLPLDAFRNDARLTSVTCPVLIIHGTRDTVIDPLHANRLYAAANEPKRLLWVEGAGHNDLLLKHGEDYVSVLRDFPRSVTEK